MHRAPAQPRQRFASIVGALHRKAFLFQHFGQGAADVVVVVDNQDRARAH
jgi:hypothetical protein